MSLLCVVVVVMVAFLSVGLMLVLLFGRGRSFVLIVCLANRTPYVAACRVLCTIALDALAGLSGQ